MDDVPGEAPNDPASDPQPQQGPWDQREQHEQRQYVSAPFPAMTAIQAMSGVSGNAALPSMSPQLSRPGHKLPFVQPSSYLRPKTRSRTTPVAPTPMSPVDEEQMQGLVSNIIISISISISSSSSKSNLTLYIIHFDSLYPRFPVFFSYLKEHRSFVSVFACRYLSRHSALECQQLTLAI